MKIKVFLFVFYSLVFSIESAFATKWTEELISPQRCEQKLNWWVNCRFGPYELFESGIQKSDIPLKTVVRTFVEGNCKTQFPLQLKLYSSGKDMSYQDPNYFEAMFSVLRNDEIIIKQPNRGPLGQVRIVDATDFSRAAAFNLSCHTWIEIETDIPDVSSPGQAVEVLRIVGNKVRENYFLKESFKKIFNLTMGLRKTYESSNYLFQKIASDSKGPIRQKAEVLELIEKISDSELSNFSIHERKVLLDFHDFLEQLKESPNSSLNDFLSPKDRLWIEELFFDPDPLSLHQSAVNTYSTQLAQVCTEWTHVNQVLKDWLSELVLEEFTDVVQTCDSK